MNALRAFDAVARHGSFQKAADELNVTSPAIQQLVRSLEEAVGQPLITRQNRKLGLSGAAASAMPFLSMAFENLAAAVAGMRSYARPKGITVSVEPSFAAAWLLNRLQDFQERHPDIDVFIDASLRLVDIERDADVAIRYTRPETGDYASSQLFEDETIAVCAPNLADKLADVRSCTCDWPSDVCLIHYESPRRVGLQPDWRTWLAASNISSDMPSKGLRFSDYNMVLQSAIAGHGIALASKPLIGDAMRVGLLKDAFSKSIKNGFVYRVMTTKAAASRVEVAAFVDWLVEVVKADT
ncbi:LysR substrate-binding domain-containing protein [Rhizobium setariae]|uniref:LysR substrate-binding domain-containing protein n=1 Tax=Rhizobium setariae TaxID=2801340 RepID=UPI00191A350F|nr:LysR substrate-binding domain-containing protein [Rhizobium setariae]